MRNAVASKMIRARGERFDGPPRERKIYRRMTANGLPQKPGSMWAKHKREGENEKKSKVAKVGDDEIVTK